MSEYNLMLAGAAGQGVNTAADILGRYAKCLGFNVYMAPDYQSRIRGGHNFIRLRIADKALAAAVGRLDVLLAFNQESIAGHRGEMKPGGLIIAAEDSGNQAEKAPADLRFSLLPRDLGPPEARQDKFTGIKFPALLAALLGLPMAPLRQLVEEMLGTHLSARDLATNLAIIDDAARFEAAKNFSWSLPACSLPESSLLLSGHAALALGLTAGGLGFYAGYPMSPATSVMNHLASFAKKLDFAVEQVEDEIAAVNAALGAAFAGLRAATGSSGGGIALMSEGLGLAGISETPLVVVNAQRSGPATGMATRSEQGDLLQVLFAGQGEFPRIVLAPSNAEEAFYLAAEALNLAEIYQVPVFLLTDQILGDAQVTVEELDWRRIEIDRGRLAPEPDEPALLARYALTDSGISPRAFAGSSRWIIQQDSHEHTEVGRLSDDRRNRQQQYDKRRCKLTAFAAPLPEIEGDADGLVLLTWGSTAGPLREAVGRLRAEGFRLGLAVFRYLNPLPVAGINQLLAGAQRLMTVEMNASGQLGRWLKMECGLPLAGHLGRIDGRIFLVEELYEMIRDQM